MALPNIMSLGYLLPGVVHKIDFSRAIRGLRGMPRRVLLIGHKLSAGTLLLGTIAQVNTESDVVALAGEGSMLTAMWRAAKANADVSLPIDIVAVAPAAGAAAAHTTVLVDTDGANVTAAGEVVIYIGGVRIAVGVTQADTAATCATALIAAINAIPSLPVVAEATETAAEVMLTCKWVGATGNAVDVRSAYYPDDAQAPGVTLTIPVMTGGTTSPDMDAVVTAMTSYRATEIVTPFTDSTGLAALEQELANRWSANNMQDGQLVFCLRGNVSDITTALATRNSDQVHTIAVKNDCTSPWETAAMAAALIESQAALDPAVPYTGQVLVGYMGPRKNGLEPAEQNALLAAGASPLAVASDGSAALGRVVTNYTQNRIGAADASRRELPWVKTMSYYRWTTVSTFQLHFADGWKIAEYITDPIPGQKIMTANIGEEIMIGNYIEFQKAGIMQNLDYYRGALQVEVDGSNGRLKIIDEPVLVTQYYQTEITSYPVAGHV